MDIKLRGIDKGGCKATQSGKLLTFKAYPLRHRPPFQSRMAAARLGKAADQHLIGGIEEEYLYGVSRLPDFLYDLFVTLEKIAAADVHDQPHVTHRLLGVFHQLDERGE